MEHLLHYVWKHKLFSLEILQTTKGLPVEVIDPGLRNPNSGPDFFNAKLNKQYFMGRKRGNPYPFFGLVPSRARW